MRGDACSELQKLTEKGNLRTDALATGPSTGPLDTSVRSGRGIGLRQLVTPLVFGPSHKLRVLVGRLKHGETRDLARQPSRARRYGSCRYDA